MTAADVNGDSQYQYVGCHCHSAIRPGSLHRDRQYRQAPVWSDKPLVYAADEQPDWAELRCDRLRRCCFRVCPPSRGWCERVNGIACFTIHRFLGSARALACRLRRLAQWTCAGTGNRPLSRKLPEKFAMTMASSPAREGACAPQTAATFLAAPIHLYLHVTAGTP